MRPPAFWNIKHGRDAAKMLRTLLLPLSWVYEYFTQSRIRNGANFDTGKKVISIGNISLGGTGKTPLTRFLAQRLGKKEEIAIISRGYGGNLEGPIRIDPNIHTAEQAGDEPLMLASQNSVYVGKERKAAARLAIENNAQILLLDDAHQNPDLAKDVSIVVIDGMVGFGNGFVFPSGPLRERPKIGLKRADIIVWIGPKDNLDDCKINPSIPIFFANIKPIPRTVEGKYLAFCGIGHPEKFLTSLKEIGIDPMDLIPFPDHHYFSDDELKSLSERANDEGARLITTEKDFIRIVPNKRENIEVLYIDIEFENENAFFKTLQSKLEID